MLIAGHAVLVVLAVHHLVRLVLVVRAHLMHGVSLRVEGLVLRELGCSWVLASIKLLFAHLGSIDWILVEFSVGIWSLRREVLLIWMVEWERRGL